MGFYIPARHHPTQAELDALKHAALELEKLLAAHKLTEDELMSEFRALKRGKKKR